MMKRFVFSFSMVFFFSFLAMAQQEAKNVRSGNRLYKKDKYTEAEIEYRKGLSKNKQSFEANYNLGNALYKQGKYKEACEQYGNAAALCKEDKERLAASFHNAGNALFKEKEYAKSVEAYKNALKLNSKDDRTRYNLALAKAMLQQQQNNKQQNKNNKQDKNNQNQPQNQPQQNQENKKDKQQNQPKQDNSKMTEENAKQILDALLQDEKDVQNRVQENQKKNAKQRRVEKDW